LVSPTHDEKKFTMQKYNLQKKKSSNIRNQKSFKILLLITLLTNLKFQHKQKKNHLFKILRSK
jgi:hypothetical protein